MDDLDRKLRSRLLAPLKRRRASPAASKNLSAAIAFFRKQAGASEMLAGLVQLQKQAKRVTEHGNSRELLNEAKALVLLVRGLFLARKISFQQYTFSVSLRAEHVHDERISEGAYKEITELMNAIKAVEKSHGLADDEYWPVGDGPAEYLALNTQFERAANQRFVETLNELGASDLAELFSTDRLRYDQLRERGRRYFNHKDEFSEALKDTVLRYEAEAKIAATAGAFSAAVALLGAAVEGTLLLRCLKSRMKAEAIAAGLPAQKRPRNHKRPSSWSFDNLIEICLRAGWLPEVAVGDLIIRPDRLAHVLRETRNLIHPGKVAAERPWIELDENDYLEAEAIYTTVFAALRGTRRSREQPPSEL